MVPGGYVDHMEMFPMDFEEFLWAINIDERVIGHVKEKIASREPIGDIVHQSMMRYLSWYMLVGGMPRAVSNFTEKHTFDGVRMIQNNIMLDYQDDMSKYCDRKEVLKTRRCFESLERQLGRNNKKFIISAIEPEL